LLGMKQSWRLRWILLLAAAAALFSACSGGAVKLSYENGAFRNSKTGAAYLQAPVCYRAVSIRKNQVVAKLNGVPEENSALYAIGDMDSEKWLADQTYAVYYGEGEPLPTLREMNVNCVTLCQIGAYNAAIGVLEGRAEIEDLVDIYERGTTVARSAVVPSAGSRFELLFSSETYPGLYYVLEYWKYAEEVVIYAQLENGEIPSGYPGRAEIVNGEAAFHLGTGLVYDRSADRFYAIGDILESYFNGDSD